MLTTVTVQDIYEAEKRIRPFIYKTPLLTKTALSDKGGWTKGLFFKCEALQRTGSFKIRGSQNAVIKILEERRRKTNTTNDNKNQLTFICHSSGNHGQALARAAKMNGQRAHLVVPRTAPKAKIAAMMESGAEITFCEPTLQSREAVVKNLIYNVYGKDYAVFVHPFDNDDVIAGQGTCGLEIAQQFPIALQERNSRDPFLLSSPPITNNNTSSSSSITPVFIIPIGGGGLVSGVSLALRHKFPNSIIIGAEPAEADDASRSFISGKIEPLKTLPPNTMADGLMTTLAPRTLAILSKTLDGIITVTESEIALATKEILQRLKIVIEPSAGVPAAVALLKRDEIVKRFGGVGKNLDAAVCILCGGNIDLGKIGNILSKI